MKKLWADRAWDDFFRISSWNALEVMAKIGMEATSGREIAYGHFPRPSGPRSPARQGHIKRPVLRLAEPSFLRPANQCC